MTTESLHNNTHHRQTTLGNTRYTSDNDHREYEPRTGEQPQRDAAIPVDCLVQRHTAPRCPQGQRVRCGRWNGEATYMPGEVLKQTSKSHTPRRTSSTYK